MLYAINIENSKTLKCCILKKKIALFFFFFFFCSKCGSEYKTIFKEEESVEISKVLGLITIIEKYQKIYIIMTEKNISQECRLKSKDERKKLLHWRNPNMLMPKKHKSL